MTTIRINWEMPELEAKGHAGGGPRGQNIICAGISAVTMALLNTLRQYLDDGKDVEWQINEDTGYLKIRAKPSAINREMVMHFYEMAYIGLKAIEQEYPEEIKIKEVQDGGNVGQDS